MSSRPVESPPGTKRLEEQVGMNAKDYRGLIRYAESFLEKYGDNYLGVGWTKKQEYADARYRVMLELLRTSAGEIVTVLDFGCGASHLYEYIRKHGRRDIAYAGLDLSSRFLELSRRKFPVITYYELDILEGYGDLPDFDYIIMNGIFNSKCEMTFDEMFTYLKDLVTRVFAKARRGVAFNVMSKQVDWERDDLFHVPMDLLASFLTREVSRHFVLRHDYGLYEYTAYVYRDPT
jgi:SAM-dependent methyltransferase